MILLLVLAPALVGSIQISKYTTARNYLSITSENYPDSYPGPDSWWWQWSVDSGQWAVVFQDFDLASDGHHDRLVISDPGRNLTFTRKSPPTTNYAYVIDSPQFTMQLYSSGENGQHARGFKSQVLYGSTRDGLQSTIDDMEMKDDSHVSKGDNGSLPTTHTVVILLLAIIVPLVVIIVVGALVLMLLRRRQLLQQSTTNTSVHLNIGAIRRDSSVSYTRNGNGPPPGGARSRLDSESSLSPDSAGRPKRPVKRSESNASWAMRAEMNTTVRNGSSSSQGQGQHAALTNVYSTCPGESTLPQVAHRGFFCKGESAMGCRLSTICEESSSGMAKLSASFPVPLHADQPSLAVANAGYMVMTSCSAHYAN